MSFSLQAKCLEYLVLNEGKLDKKLYSVPLEIDHRVAELKLDSLGVKIDHLSDDQIEYLNKVE